MARKGADLWRRDPRPGMLVVVAGVALALFLGLVLAVMISPAFVAADEAASTAFHDLRVPALETTFAVLTHVADFWPMVGLTGAAALVLWLLGKRSEIVLLVSVMIIGPSIGAATKLVVERARPGLDYARIALPDSYSFPSGHALATFLLFGTIIFIVLLDATTLRTRMWTVVSCSTAVILVGVSRVYLGVHWFGDITASWILGFGIMSLATALYFIATTGDSELDAKIPSKHV